MAQLIRPLASEKCQQEKRKTVNGEDILFAMTSTGFENYAEALKIYLAKYREVSSSALCLFQPHVDMHFPLISRLFSLTINVNILTAACSLNHSEERHSRRDRAVATGLKARSRVQPERVRRGNRTRRAQRRIKDKKRASTTS